MVPDFTRNADDEIIKSLQSDYLMNAREYFQPSPDPKARCTVLTTYTPHLESSVIIERPLPWLKVPCDEKLIGSVGLCQATVLTGRVILCHCYLMFYIHIDGVTTIIISSNYEEFIKKIKKKVIMMYSDIRSRFRFSKSLVARVNLLMRYKSSV